MPTTRTKSGKVPPQIKTILDSDSEAADGSPSNADDDETIHRSKRVKKVVKSKKAKKRGFHLGSMLKMPLDITFEVFQGLCRMS
jgi:hypothetical protein